MLVPAERHGMAGKDSAKRALVSLDSSRIATADSNHATSVPPSGDPAAHSDSATRGRIVRTQALRSPLDSGSLAGLLPQRKVVWNASDGPLLLRSDVVVGPGQSLVIGPGTEVRLAARDKSPAGKGDWADSQFVSLIVRGGSLRILGTASHPVHFIPLRKGNAPLWGGIEVVDVRTPSQVEIAWTDIPRALVAMDFERASAKVRHVVVRSGNMGFRIAGGSAPEISHSIVFGEQIAGLHSERSGPVVRGCIFVDNAGPAMRFDGVGLARIETTDFWNNAGGDILRGPVGTGGWPSDTIVKPDAYGNIRTNPVFRASALHAMALARKQDSLRQAPIWKRRLPKNPPGEGPWALSPFSPLLDRGSRSPLCRDLDASPCDIGLWGGSD